MQSVLKLLTSLDKLVTKLITITVVALVMVAVMPKLVGDNPQKPQMRQTRQAQQTQPRQTSRVTDTTKPFKASHVTLSYWPPRKFTNWMVLPSSDSAFSSEEYAYLKNLTRLLEAGITNRMNIDEALTKKQPVGDYLKFADLFKEKQSAVLDKIRYLPPPDSLNDFHGKIEEATRDQINFYDSFANRKSQDPSLEIKSLVQDTDLKSCHENLWDAYIAYQKAFPKSKPATDQAIRARLAWMDMI